MNDREKIFEQVYDLVGQIPRGKVSTYGEIAKVVGVGPRYVGYILHNNPSQDRIPCHRVVSGSGNISANFAFGGPKSQENLLRGEGLLVQDGRVELGKYLHNF